MSDELRRRLARAAGDGDIDAAKRLVVLLEREGLARDWPLSPDAALCDLAPSDFLNQEGRIRKIVRRGLQKKIGDMKLPASEAQELLNRVIANAHTLRDVASLSVQEFANVTDCGPKTLAIIDALLARAGLQLKDDPTMRVTHYLENTVEKLSPSRANRSLPTGLASSSFPQSDEPKRP